MLQTEANEGLLRDIHIHRKNASYNREVSLVDYLDYLAPLYCFNDFASTYFLSYYDLYFPISLQSQLQTLIIDRNRSEEFPQKLHKKSKCPFLTKQSSKVAYNDL